MNKFLISFDIDGTLGKQTCQITSGQDICFDKEHIVEIIGDSYGNFIFFRGVIDLLKKIKNLNFTIILNTGGFKTKGAFDRNEAIVNYLEKILTVRLDLYDITYQTFHSQDIQDAKDGKIKNSHWQEWFEFTLARMVR
jgi:hypothetical protein